MRHHNCLKRMHVKMAGLRAFDSRDFGKEDIESAFSVSVGVDVSVLVLDYSNICVQIKILTLRMFLSATLGLGR